MTTYRNQRLGFEIEVPDKWPDPTVLGPEGTQFSCGSSRAFTVLRQPSAQPLKRRQIRRRLARFVRDHGYRNLIFGQLSVHGEPYHWATYRIGRQIHAKTYLLYRGGYEYAITGTCLREQRAEAGAEWNMVVRSFRPIESTAQELTRTLNQIAALTQRGDMAERTRLCRQALSLIKREDDPHQWATLQSELAASLGKNTLGDVAQNQEDAIQACERALDVFTQDAHPVEWANTHNILAAVYRQRIRGERSDNVERTIEHLWHALQIYTPQRYPEQWAGVQNNLANAYRDRIEGIRAENLEQSILHLRRALEVYTLIEHPWHWATAQNNLANVYANRVRGDKAQNVERAARCCQEALTVFTREAFPEDWAWTHSLLGPLHHSRTRGDRAANLENGIWHCKQALGVFTRERLPVKWAVTHFNLGNLYADRSRGGRAENDAEAAGHYKLAREVLTQETHPLQWTGIELGLRALAARREGTQPSRDQPAEGADTIRLFNTLRDPASNPADWAAIQVTMGEQYRLSMSGDRAANLERAIACYERALTVCTRDRYADVWAAAQNNLAIAFTHRLRGDAGENRERAIRHATNALEVYAREAYPEDWAMATNNLGQAWRRRVHGDPEQNARQAIACFERAIEVYTRAQYPGQWADVHYNLALAWAGMPPDATTAQTLQRAIDHCLQALQVYTQVQHAQDWAMMHKQLAYLYSDPKLGDAAERYERARQHVEAALTVYTRQTDPANWASTHYALALALSGSTRGDPTANAHRALQQIDKALQVFTPDAYPAQHQIAKELRAQVEAYLTSHRGRGTAFQSPQPARASDRGSLTYPQTYEAEAQREPGAPRTLTLIQSGIPDFSYLTYLILVYQWQEDLPDEEAQRLCKRAIAYIACAIYDAAAAAGLACRAHPYMNGRRPSWQIEGEGTPISLLLSDIDLETRTCQMTIGTVVTMMGKQPPPGAHWEQLHAGCRERFQSITV